MIPVNKIFRLLSVLLMVTACSGGPAPIAQPDSISSPAQQLDSGVYHYNNNNYPRAISHFEKALLQYRGIDDQAGIANSCLNLAKTYMAINNNVTAGQYLHKASEIIQHEKLTKLNEHLHLLRSSLAINNHLYPQAVNELETVLNSTDNAIQLAALKNRTTIAFNRADADKESWLNRYQSLQQKDNSNTSSHRARILRFQAELAESESSKIELLQQSLSISRTLADRTAIAACLLQWAQLDSNAGSFNAAEDKSLRALFIRHQLGDVKNSLKILQQLQSIYTASGNEEKLQQAENWINRLSNNQLDNWDRLFSDFETYPQPL